MIKLNPLTKTIICIGTGGVGKTTMAAALAMGWAHEGRRVLVLTIDPSLRLAQALGIQPNGQIQQVTDRLDATTLNHETIFKEFILKSAQNVMAKTDINKLLNNKLYQQLSTQLSGSQDFTSLYQLNEFVASQKYDLVILDTPPAQHTWGFLKAPEKISQLFNEGITQWFRDADQKNVSLFKKVFNLGTQQVLKALELLTGAQFITELSLFFTAIQKWQTPLEQKVLECQKILSANTTEFILVTAMDSSRISEAKRLSQDIQKQGYNLSRLIINRVPSWLPQNEAPLSASTNLDQSLIPQYVTYYKQLHEQLLLVKNNFHGNLQVYKSYELVHNEINAEYLLQIYKNLV